MNKHYLDAFITNALQEDIGDGDITSLACIPENKYGTAQLVIKQKGILAGVETAHYIFKKFDNSLNINILINDGNKVNNGDIVLIAEGKVISILQTERLVLNIMQRMSGIATSTDMYVQKLAGLKTRILDTRKTTPGMRFLEKEAVRIGGGQNHRMGLYDMVLIKDNHIDFAGGIEQAINKVTDFFKRNNKTTEVIIEARNISDVEKIITVGGINRILLDNFSVDLTREAVKLINGNYETESSGGITLENIREYAECGVDYVSVGALTHHVKSLDMSLIATNDNQ